MSIQELKFFRAGFVIYRATKSCGLLELFIAKGERHTAVYMDNFPYTYEMNIQYVNTDKFGFSKADFDELKKQISVIATQVYSDPQKYLTSVQ